MKELIEAFQIFNKYTDDEECIQCDHDIMYVAIPCEFVSEEDKNRLEELGFHADEEDLGTFYSFKYGSC